MKSINAKTKVRIWGTKNAWSLDPNSEADSPGTLCDVSLEIQGDQRNGYHLVMSPSGFFTGDHWYETKKDALDDAKELFGVDQSDWVESS